MDVILDAIKRQSMSDQWRKDGGKYIPGPEKWLLEKRWTDEVEVSGATCSLGEAEMDAIKKVLSQS